MELKARIRIKARKKMMVMMTMVTKKNNTKTKK